MDSLSSIQSLSSLLSEFTITIIAAISVHYPNFSLFVCLSQLGELRLFAKCTAALLGNVRAGNAQWEMWEM